jgi:hypothetical protein
VTRPAGEGTTPPRLFVLGVDPSPDGAAAAAATSALETAGAGAFGEVVTHLLRGEQATPERVNAELERIRSQATLADTTLVYYAGQETLDTAGHYRLSAARGGSTDPAGVWLSDHELKQRLGVIPGKVLMAVDTTRAEQRSAREASAGFCGSSAVDDVANRLDAAAGDFLRDLLTDEYGIVVLRGARRASAAPAGKTTSSFSQAFVEAVGGRADHDHDGTVHLHELSRYVHDRVRELSGGKQSPVIESPRGVRSFPLAQPGSPAPAREGPASR